MATSNKLVEDLGNGFKRETNFDGPATETENARNRQLGPFHSENVGAGTSATAMPVGGANAEVNWVAPHDGTILGLAWSWTAAPTHTAATVQVSVGGTAKGDTISVDGAQTGTKLEATPVAFVAGNSLGAKFTTDVNFLPTTDDLTVWLLVRWAA